MERDAIKKLKILRIQNELKQKDMAKLLEISVSTYNYKENGLSDFTLPEIKKIIKLFNESFDSIFFEEEIRNRGINSNIPNPKFDKEIARNE